MNERKQNPIKRILSTRGMGGALTAFAGLIAIYIAFGIINPTVFSGQNIMNLLRSMSKYLLIGIGQSYILITGNIDLSIGSVAGMSAMISATLMTMGVHPIAAILITLACCLVIGVLNGLLVGKWKLPPFIATLGMQTIVYGLCSVVTGNDPLGGFKSSYSQVALGSLGPIPYLAIFAVAVGAYMLFLYNKTRHGKYMYAIGGNENAAQGAGVNVPATLIRIYVLASVLYAIAGFLVGAKAGGASTATGFGYELEAIAACTIGGVSTNGGVGKVGGILIGVLVFEILKICLQFLRVDPAYTFIAQGLVIIVAVALDLRKYLAKK